MDHLSGHSGRRGPNVSPFIGHLNTIPSGPDMSPEGPESFNFADDLAMFTNTQFFDFDLGEMVDTAPIPYDPEAEERARRQNASAAAAAAAHERHDGVDFLNDDYRLPDFPGLQNLLDDGTSLVTSLIPATNPPITTTVYPASATSGSPSVVASTTIAAAAGGSVPSPRTGDKRKADVRLDSSRAATTTSSSSSPPSSSLEETSRLAAEEDKRRRNTAASARFRVKKKQREQTLERTAKEMTEKVTQLETRIGQLETENKWLKNLITEKNENKDDITDLWRKFNNNKDGGGATVLRSTVTDRKDGVGTTATTTATAVVAAGGDVSKE